jgi:hypothetical protein
MSKNYKDYKVTICDLPYKSMTYELEITNRDLKFGVPNWHIKNGRY